MNPSESLSNIVDISLGVIPLAWAFLVAMAVLGEPPVGEDSFWLTRPYSRISLFASKILFMLVFVNFPWLVCDCAILAKLGLPIDPLYLLLRQIPLCSMVIVPAFVLASISKGIAQFALVLVSALVCFMLESLASNGFLRERYEFRLHISDMRGLTIPLIVGLALAGVEFTQRSRAVRWPLAALVVLPISPILLITRIANDATFLAPRRLEAPNSMPLSKLQLKIEQSDCPHAIVKGLFGGILVPLSVTGQPDGTLLTGMGEAFISRLKVPIRSRLVRDSENRYGVEIDFPYSLRDLAFSVTICLHLTAVNNKATVTTTGQRLVKIPGLGFCFLGLPRAESECWYGPALPYEMTIRSGASTAHLTSNDYWLDDPAIFQRLNWALTPIQDKKIAFDHERADEVSFIPWIPVSHADALLAADRSPLAPCEQGVVIKKD